MAQRHVKRSLVGTPPPSSQPGSNWLCEWPKGWKNYFEKKKKKNEILAEHSTSNHCFDLSLFRHVELEVMASSSGLCIPIC